MVGLTALTGAVTAHRGGSLMLGRGIAFGVVAIGGAAAGAMASALVPGPVLMAAFAVLMFVVAGVMLTRQLKAHQATRRGEAPPARAQLDDPIITFSPHFACACPRALQVLITATVVGLLTGFLGVGGRFLVVPALVLALGLPLALAAGTSLVVIAITSAAALAVRAGVGAQPDWAVVALLTVFAVAGGHLGARLACRLSTTKLQCAFTLLLVLVAAYTGTQALPALT